MGVKQSRSSSKVQLLNNSMISFEEMIKQNSVFDGFKKPKNLLQNIFQRFDVECRSMLFRLYAKHINKYSVKEPISFAEERAPFTPNKAQKKAIKKINELYANPFE